MLNVAREDLPLRTETFYLLKKLGVDVDELTFYPEVAEALRASSSEVVLVDHNALIRSQEFLGTRVVEIVDHHTDSSLYTEQCKERGRCVTVIGSTCSLVALLLCNVCHDALQSGGSSLAMVTPSCADFPISKDIATLLLGTTLIDTMNNDPAMKKSTPYDVKATQVMSTVVFDNDIAAEKCTALYDELVEKKYATDGLTIAMSLRKDYKAFEMGAKTVGMASVVEGLDTLGAKGDLLGEMQAFMASRSLDVLIIMSLTREEGGVARWISFLPEDPAFLQELLSSAEGSLGALLQLELVTGEAYPKGVATYRQRNVEVSRKILSPALTSYFKK